MSDKDSGWPEGWPKGMDGADYLNWRRAQHGRRFILWALVAYGVAAVWIGLLLLIRG